jgi:hypothetical protein
MNSFKKVVVKTGLLSLLLVMPLAAQVDNSVVFTAPFPFYAGKVELPAGTYKISEPNENIDVVLIRSIAGTRSAFLDFTPTSSIDPYSGTDVTFHKYGDTGYLEGVSVVGETEGLEFKQTKAEAEAATMAENTNVVEHATIARGE